MKRVVNSDPDILLFRSGGGPLAVFGIPFLLAGLFVMLTPSGVIPIEGELPPWFVAIPFGAVFALVGSVMVFGRHHITIDRRRRMLDMKWTLIVPVRERKYPLDFYRMVRIDRETKRSKNSTYTVYPVRLEAGVGAETVTLEEPLKYEEARVLAEEMARFLGLALADGTSGAEVVREAARLDESLKEQAKRTKETVYVPSAPPGMKSRIREEAQSVIVEIPSPGFGRAHYAKAAVPVFFILVVLYFFLLPLMTLPMPPPLRLFFVLFIGMFLILLPLLTTLRSIRAETQKSFRITATPALLRVEVSAPRGSTVTDIPAAEVEEVVFRERQSLSMTPMPGGGAVLEESAMLRDDMRKKVERADGKPVTVGPKTVWLIRTLTRLTPPPAITVRSDKATVTFGEGLSEEELRYIHGLIRKMLAG